MSERYSTTPGGVGETIRNILRKLGLLELKTTGHDQDITALKAKALKVQEQLDNMVKVANYQGKALEDHENKVRILTKELAALERETSNQIKSLQTTVRGEQIKRGKALAKAGRAEELAGKLEQKLQRPRK
jgi:hypothetical protein